MVGVREGDSDGALVGKDFSMVVGLVVAEIAGTVIGIVVGESVP